MIEPSKTTKGFRAWHLAAGAAILMTAWLAFSFHSLTSLFEAYQVAWFKTHFSALTFLLLLAGPVGLGIVAWQLKNRNEPSPTSARELLIAQARQTYHAFLGVCGLAALLLLFVLISWGLAPSNGGARPRISANAPKLAEGGVTLIGRTVAGKAVIYEKTMLLASRRMQFVPVETMEAAHPAVRYIIEVPPTSEQVNRAEYAGIAVKNGLPAQVIEQFAGAGYTIAKPYAVIYNNAESLNWSTKLLVAQLALVLIALAIATFIQRTAYRRALASPAPA